MINNTYDYLVIFIYYNLAASYCGKCEWLEMGDKLNSKMQYIL